MMELDRERMKDKKIRCHGETKSQAIQARKQKRLKTIGKTYHTKHSERGSELNSNTGWYETFFWGYDAGLARFNQIDPLAGHYIHIPRIITD